MAIDQVRYNILRWAGICAIALGLVLLVSAAAVSTHEEHYCYLKECKCYNTTATICRKWKVDYWIDDQEEFTETNHHTFDLPVCPRCTIEKGPGFLCWTDNEGDDLHIASPAERTLTNLVTASFTFSVSGVFYWC
jgi:hypothetical protein